MKSVDMYTLGEKRFIAGFDLSNKPYVRSLRAVRWYDTMEAAYEAELSCMTHLGASQHELAYQWLEGKLPLNKTKI